MDWRAAPCLEISLGDHPSTVEKSHPHKLCRIEITFYILCYQMVIAILNFLNQILYVSCLLDMVTVSP